MDVCSYVGRVRVDTAAKLSEYQSFNQVLYSISAFNRYSLDALRCSSLQFSYYFQCQDASLDADTISKLKMIRENMIGNGALLVVLLLFLITFVPTYLRWFGQGLDRSLETALTKGLWSRSNSKSPSQT